MHTTARQVAFTQPYPDLTCGTVRAILAPCTYTCAMTERIKPNRWYRRKTYALLWLLALSTCQPSEAKSLRTVHATVPYAISGKLTVFGPDGKPGKYATGGQIVFYHSLLDTSGREIGKLAGHCHIVSDRGTDFVAVCTKHYDWLDGSTMTGHDTQVVAPGKKQIKARIVIAGGIGMWEGAHGEDSDFVYDPTTGEGSAEQATVVCKYVLLAMVIQGFEHLKSRVRENLKVHLTVAGSSPKG